MKNILKSLCLAMLFSQLFAGLIFDEIRFFSWQENGGEISKSVYPEGQYGPLSFQVDDTVCRIMDNQNQRVLTWTGEKLTRDEKLPVTRAIDFFQAGETRYYMTPNEIYSEKNGICKNIYRSSDARDVLSDLQPADKELRFNIDDQHLCISQEGTLQRSEAAAEKIERLNSSTLILTLNGKTREMPVADLGTVEYLGRADESRHYIYIETITQQVPLQVRRSLWVVNNDFDILAQADLPREQVTYMYRMFRVTDGKLYHLHASQDGLHLFQWQYDPQRAGDDRYPAEFNSGLFFGDVFTHRADAPENSDRVNSNSPVSRTEALAIGDEFVQHAWIATADNIGTTTTVTTPSWIVVGMNTKIPYKWGGWDTVEQFDAGIAAGKLAGDKNTSVVDWGNSVGADCSGFVSVCWKTDHKYGTSTISGCSWQLSSYDDLLPGDATNNAGSHIRMFVEWTSTGLLKQVEETSGGGAVWGARYYNWRSSDITSYVPIRYDNIQDNNPSRVTLNAVCVEDDSLRVSWVGDDDPNATHYRIYARTDSDNDFFLLGSAGSMERSWACPDTFPAGAAVKVTGYNSGSDSESMATDIYRCRKTADTRKILFVDGFDRNGSFSGLTHNFAEWTAETVSQHNLSTDACSNDAVLAGDVELGDYYLVWWILGDESTADETFSSAEQILVKDYLREGGRLFVSGSEIAWDLDNKGSSADKAFIHDFLKTKYVADDADNYSVSGVSGSDLAGLSLTYSKNGNGNDNYPEDYPDVLGSNGGSAAVLTYGSGTTAATLYTGVIDTGSVDAAVMVMGFPFETIVGFDKRDETASYILYALGYTDLETAVTEIIVPENCLLVQNYPNPFNPQTTIAYTLPRAGRVCLQIFDISGKYAGDLVNENKAAGAYRVTFNGTSFPAGVYVYRLTVNGETVTSRKMTLLK